MAYFALATGILSTIGFALQLWKDSKEMRTNGSSISTADAKRVADSQQTHFDKVKQLQTAETNLEEAPLEVPKITLAASVHRRRGPQQQKVRHGRDRTAVKRLCRVYALDNPFSDLDEVNTDSEAQGCVERDLAVGLDAKIRGASQNSLQDLVNDGPGARNVDVLGFLWRGMDEARGATNEYELATELWPDQAGGGAETLEERFADGGGDGDES
ncbi:hypothetical protein F5X68DRAFT_240147 [Plectosphaerella plurivora]|uniref:Uncharacterized protein n=1 Tax=Plectosphaerella plurivora TaxID=936078 RepID=A0A9P9ABF9_9PEZI|nr:hypothetical protein F5X68DRAFT_240147 [Plectosphaerella plurivora]